LPLVGRTQQIEELRRVIANYSNWSKFVVPTLITSRGMGKTFLLKRLGLQRENDAIDIPEFKNAGKVGRVISIETVEAVNAFGDASLSIETCFWQSTIILHLAHIFNNTTVDGIYFESFSLNKILSLWNVESKTKFESWAKKTLENSVDYAFSELTRLTNLAFRVHDTSTPLFLLDNVHSLTTPTSVQSTSYTTKKPLFHTQLSSLLNKLTSVRPFCIVAGTADASLSLLSEYSNFVPHNIYLTPFKMVDFEIYGEAYFQYLNQNSLTKGIWPEKVNENNILHAAVSSTCFVPRLLKLLVISWFDFCTFFENNENSFFVNFTKEAHKYYKDACENVLLMESEDLARLLLCCGVNMPFESNENIPGTNLVISDLVHAAIVFPYNDKTITFPTFLWGPFALSQTLKHQQKWTEVFQCVGRLVHGVELSDLFVPLCNFSLFNLTEVGRCWEKIVASSIAVKYKLESLRLNREDIPLRVILNVDPNSPLQDVIGDITVSLTNGVQIPCVGSEATIETDFPNAIVANYNFPTAHYDLILSTNSKALFSKIAIQCKNSLHDPSASTVYKQLWQGILLWFYPGLKSGSSPKFQLESVKDAIKKNRLGFVGIGAASIFSVEILTSLKLIGKTDFTDSREINILT
jgi:hypothetical protein